MTAKEAFMAGFRLAERVHGIGEKDSIANDIEPFIGVMVE